jgi:PAS domain S-box-containing protein
MESNNEISVPAALLMAALRSTNDGVVIADAKIGDQPLIYVNPAFSLITGYSYEETVGKNCRFLQGEERNQPELSVLRDAVKRGTECRVILRNFRKDGSPFWNELHIAPIRDEGELLFYVGVQTDVTARIEAEQQAEKLRIQLNERNRELEELNEQKNHFIGMAAHDLRNPLNNISITAQLLESRASRDGSSQEEEFLGRIRKSADFMADLIGDMLDVSRIESGHLELLREPADLAKLIEEALMVQQHAATKKRITIQRELQPGIVLDIDPRKIMQVVDNLISNAIKFSPECSEILLTVQEDQSTALMKVSDRGCGISPADQDLIFKPFGRSGNTPTTGGESSTGLGLFISKNIVEAHGGRLTVDSHTGEGSTFTMHLPTTA